MADHRAELLDVAAVISERTSFGLSDALRIWIEMGIVPPDAVEASLCVRNDGAWTISYRTETDGEWLHV